MPPFLATLLTLLGACSSFEEVAEESVILSGNWHRGYKYGDYPRFDETYRFFENGEFGHVTEFGLSKVRQSGTFEARKGLLTLHGDEGSNQYSYYATGDEIFLSLIHI